MKRTGIVKNWELLHVLFAAIVVCGGLSLTTANASYPILKLDIGRGHDAAETQAGFTAFTVNDSGTVVDGIKVEIAPMITGEAIQQRWRGGPTGIPYEQLYRDFIFTVNGGLRITLSELNPNETYEITLYSWDQASAEDHITDWLANGDFCLTTSFTGGTSVGAEDDYAFSGNATADDTGMIVLEATPNPSTSYPADPGQYFCFLNAVVVSSLTPVNKARRPIPEDGAIITTTEVELQWTPGNTSVSSNIYIGESFDDVNQATTENTNIFRGNTIESSFPIGSAGNPYPDGLSEETTYYWRIDEVEEDGTENKGDIWSFTIAPKTAFTPTPIDGTLFIDPNVTLSWIPGAGSIEHHVYFGDVLEDVQAGTADTDKGTVTEPNYAPGLLEREKTYYWRIDESDGTNIYAGDVWSFTTSRSNMGTVTMDLWENVEGDHNLVNLLNDPRYPESPTRSEALTEFGTVDGVGDSYGAQISGWLYCPVTGQYTFWLSCAGAGELWLSTDDDPANNVLLASESNWGTYNSFSIKTVPVSLVAGQKYYIMTRWKDFGSWDHCQVAWQGPGIREMEIIQGNYLSPFEPVHAFGPNPGNGSVDIRIDPVITWRAGIYAGSHVVNFGTDPNTLEQVDIKELGNESYDPGRLEMETTYYWRIDEVNDTEPNSPWIGDIWSFTTGNFLVVDDFEDYNDFEFDRIFDSWLDGYGTTTNGSTIGYAEPDFPAGEHFVETTIVHGGSQSMPYFYDNTVAGNSEATLTLTDLTDWTDEGVEILSLWFQGYPPYLGSFTEDPAGTYTMTATGTDIWDTSDEFHFAYKQLTGVGSITARVLSVDNTDPWAKAGVMLRNTLEPDSRHASIFITPGQGVSFQRRLVQMGASTETTESAIEAPQWIRIERDIGGNFTASYSTNGSTWTQLGTDSINMNATLYVGLALTSHNTEETCEAVFSNVTIDGNVSQDPWMDQDIGILSNDPERMYVVLDGNAVVYHEDSDVSTIDDWTEWRIDLQDFADQGIDLTDVESIGIGFGDRDNPQAGGAGLVFFDDIRLYRPIQ